MLKTFLQHIAVVLCKKRLQKTANIRKMRAFGKLEKWPPRKGNRLCKIVTWAQKLIIYKNMVKTFLQHIAVVLCKSGSKKQLIFAK